MEVRYRYRLRVNSTQARSLQQVFDSCRFVWNMALGRWQDLWRHEELNLSYVDAAHELTDWRGTYDWLSAQPQNAQEQVLRDLFSSVTAYFSKSNPAGRPRFKKKGTHATARWTRNGFSVKDGRLHVAVAGGCTPLRVVWSRPLPSEPRSVTVYRDPAGHWWASFVVRVEPEDIGQTGETTGLDLGLNTFATTEYADADVPNPRFARHAAKALARSQRKLFRKQEGSTNRARARCQVAKVHAKVRHQRADWQHKTARQLARRFDRIGVEDLPVKNMRRKGRGRHKTGLNRAINDASWGSFIACLEWHARKAGHQVVRMDPRNTTQTCSECGVKAKHRLELADRTFVCEACGLVLDRDRNAAFNLNPNRLGCTGGGDDGSKTRVPAWAPAA